MDYFDGDDKNEKVIVKQEKVNTKKVIYLGGLPPDVDKYELNQFILSQGKFNIEEMMTKNFPKPFAYIKFKTKDEAQEALKVLHLKEFKNYIIKAEPFKSSKNKEQKNTNTDLFVNNLPKDCTPKDVYEAFIKFGKIESVELKTNSNGVCLGYGYVDFATEESANEAIEKMDGAILKDNVIKVSLFTPKNVRMENAGNQNILPMIVVKKIPGEMDSKELKNIFDIYGDIMISGIVNEPPIFLAENPKFKETAEELSNINRYGIILYTKREEANIAFNQLQDKYDLVLTESDSKIIDKLRKEIHDSMKAKYGGANLIVKNLPKEIDDKMLHSIFIKYGPISSAKVDTQGVMKNITDENGNILDKKFVYESKGFGYVCFKKSEDAQKAKNEISEKEIQFNNLNLKLIVEDFNYDKSSAKQLQREMNIQRGGFGGGNMRGFPPRGRGRGRGRGHPRGGMKPMNNNNMNNRNQFMMQPMMQQPQQMNNNYNMNNMNNMQNDFMINNNQNNNDKISVESEHLLEIIQEKLKIENPDDRTEAVGEKLFYFLIKFIPQYGLNNTNGLFKDEDLCSRLTGILIKTEPEILLQIISSTQNLYNSLKDVLNTLVQSQLENK
jgi:polyadenylate-binding protein